MKKMLFMCGLGLCALNALAQGSAKWSESGNSIGSSNWLGSTNNFPLLFKVNNIPYLNISPTGTYTFHALSGSGNGLFMVNSAGNVSRLNFDGNPNNYLRGDGNFGPVTSGAGWFSAPGLTYTTNKVGIGISSLASGDVFAVNGNSTFNGIVAADEFQAGNVVNANQQLRIQSSLCLKGYSSAVPGSRSEVCALGHDFYIQSTSGLNNHTILNFSNSGSVLIGTETADAAYKLLVSGNTKVDGQLSSTGENFYSGKSHFNRITGMPGDTVIRFGDSTILLDHVHNRIYSGTVVGTSPPYVFVPGKGLGIGSVNATATGTEAVAIGKYAKASANHSVAIGTFVSALPLLPPPFPSTVGSNIVIGSGASSATPLANNQPNTLMVGFNSDIPTLFVDKASGAGTTGAVAIGTNYIPAGYKLAVNGKIIGEEVVLLLRGTWPDYVFDEQYQRKNYLEKEQYILANKHLEFIEPAANVQANGVSMSSTLKGVVQNVEENTLDIIDIYKKLVELEAENKALKAQLNELKK
jgi:hypothetical protein